MKPQAYSTDRTVAARQRIERRIATQAALDLIAAGFTVSVYDGEEVTLNNSTNIHQIHCALFTTDEDYLFAMKDGKRAGWIRLIYGNDGWDVIADYTTNLEQAIAEANALADRLAE